MEINQRNIRIDSALRAAVKIGALDQDEYDSACALITAGESTPHEFKNFHRLLCERFGYVHDEKDWMRDRISLIEWIAAGKTNPQRAAFEAWAKPRGYDLTRCSGELYADYKSERTSGAWAGWIGREES